MYKTFMLESNGIMVIYHQFFFLYIKGNRAISIWNERYLFVIFYFCLSARQVLAGIKMIEVFFFFLFTRQFLPEMKYGVFSSF